VSVSQLKEKIMLKDRRDRRGAKRAEKSVSFEKLDKSTEGSV